MAELKLWKQGERDRAEHFLVKQIPICEKSTPKESCIASSWVVVQKWQHKEPEDKAKICLEISTCNSHI